MSGASAPAMGELINAGVAHRRGMALSEREVVEVEATSVVARDQVDQSPRSGRRR